MTPEQLEQNFIHHRDTPSDINQHLSKLREIYDTVEHVTEMGVRGCVSLSAALASKAKKVVAIDICNVNTPDCEKLQFICADCLKIEIEETCALMIDTLHTYAQMKAELERHAPKVRRWILMHDTQIFGDNGEDGSRPGLNAAINEFMAENPHWKLDYKTEINNGLTILKRE